MNLVGRQLAHYQVLEHLGQGSMGSVYKARDLKLERLVALKLLPHVKTEKMAARFEREAKAISALNHPHIAAIYAYERDGDTPFLVLEYLPGGTLHDRLQRLRAEHKTLPPLETVSFTLQVAAAFEHAHKKGVIHRDIKSENVLIAESGDLKVSDFGVAKLDLDSALTEEGSVLGTMAYMAPEQLLGEPFDHRADIFSFGVLAFEIAACELPFQEAHRAALQYEILNAQPPRIEDLRPDLPPAFGAVVARALEKRPEDRFSTLEEAVAILNGLRLSLHSSASDIKLVSESGRLEPGQTIGRYRLLSKVGEGGMGTVFRAHDTRLNRQVALKTLKSEALAQPERRRRFIQEAQAASALNHPNIVTIHEIDERSGVRFIAMEYIAGETLDVRLRAGGLPLSEALQFAIEIADALTAAHAAGIVHRDLKPANVMLSAEGRVKLLDFGLAKLTEGARGVEGGAEPLTEEGAILGTVAYMSPEQAEGRSVDARGDIFAFGSMLYEMATGERAFRGDSKISVLAAIIQREPEPLCAQLPNCPAELERILERCLRKRPERRFQHMGDVRIALEDLLETLERSPEPAEQPVTSGSRRRWRELAIAGAGGAALAAGVFLLMGSDRRDPDPLGSDVSLYQLTGADGESAYPSWSPDGTWIAYASDRGGSLDIWKKPVSGGEEVQLTDTPRTENQPAWSPDGRTIAFAIQSGTEGIFLMPADGGQAVRVTDFGARPAWAPDGRSIAFDWNGSIYIVNYAGGEPQELVTGTAGAPYAEWSSSGDVIFYWDRTRRDIFSVRVETGERRRLHLIPTGEEVAGLTCSKAEDTLVFSKGAFGGDKDLWRVRIDPRTGTPRGPARRLTVSATDDLQCRFSSDGARLAFTTQQLQRQLWSATIDAATGLAAGELRLLTFRGQRNYYPAASRDGKLLVWTSQNAGQGVLYYKISPEDEGRKLTREWNRATREVGAAIGPDGRQIAFSSTAGGAYQLWRMPGVDSVKLQLTEVERPLADSQPSWSLDGTLLAFYSNRSGNWDIWTVNAAQGGTPQQRTNWPTSELYPTWSPDGRTIAFVSNRNGNPDIWRLDLESGDAKPFVEHPAEEGPGVWSPDGRWFYFTSNRSGEFELYVMPANGGEPRQVSLGSMNLPQLALFTKFAVTENELIVPLETRKGNIYILEKLKDSGS